MVGGGWSVWCLVYRIPIYDAKMILNTGTTSTGFNFLAQRTLALVSLITGFVSFCATKFARVLPQQKSCARVAHDKSEKNNFGLILLLTYKTLGACVLLFCSCYCGRLVNEKG